MLTNFTITKQFYQLRLRLYVECDREVAELAIIYADIIQSIRPVEFPNVKSPEEADRWLSRPMGELGSFVEYTEHRLRIEARAA